LFFLSNYVTALKAGTLKLIMQSQCLVNFLLHGAVFTAQKLCLGFKRGFQSVKFSVQKVQKPPEILPGRILGVVETDSDVV